MVLLLIIFDYYINPSPILIWILLAITIIVSIFIGYLALRLHRLGIACAGIWLAFIITLLMQNAFLYLLSSNNVPFYVVLTLLSIALATGGWFYFDLVLILVTSLFGVLFRSYRLGLSYYQTNRLHDR